MRMTADAKNPIYQLMVKFGVCHFLIESTFFDHIRRDCSYQIHSPNETEYLLNSWLEPHETWFKTRFKSLQKCIVSVLGAQIG